MKLRKGISLIVLLSLSFLFLPSNYNLATSGTISVTATTAEISFLQSGVGTDFSGTVLTVDGSPVQRSELTKTYSWSVGSSHVFLWQNPLGVSASKRYLWTSTSGLSTVQGDMITTPSGSGSVTGNYRTQYNITINAGTGGTVNLAGGWYDASTATPITASPSVGYTFKSWVVTGGVSVSNLSSASTNMTVTGAGTLLATFEPAPSPRISFNQSGVGTDFSGEVLAIDGISIQYSELTKSYNWTIGSTHNFTWQSPLTVSAQKRYVWTSTSGLSTLQSGSVVMPSNSGSVTGIYSTEYNVAVQTPTGGSTNPAVGGWYRSGQTVGISATPSTNYSFSNWITTGSLTVANPTAGSTTFTVNGSGTIKANFTSTSPHGPVNVTVTIQSSGHGTTNPAAGTYTVQSGSQMTIEAIPKSGYEWYWWDGLTVSETVDNPVTITAHQDRNITALFRVSIAPPGIEPGMIAIIVGAVAAGVVLYLLIDKPTSLKKFLKTSAS